MISKFRMPSKTFRSFNTFVNKGMGMTQRYGLQSQSVCIWKKYPKYPKPLGQLPSWTIVEFRNLGWKFSAQPWRINHSPPPPKPPGLPTSLGSRCSGMLQSKMLNFSHACGILIKSPGWLAVWFGWVWVGWVGHSWVGWLVVLSWFVFFGLASRFWSFWILVGSSWRPSQLVSG